MYTPELPPGLAKPPTAPSSPALDAVLARDDAERARSASGTSVGSGGSGMSGPRAGHGDVTSGRRPRVSSQDLGDAADAEYPSPAPLSMRRPTRGRILDRAAERTAKFLEAVASRDGELDLEHIRALARSGLPDELGVRATYWKILLNYLPSHRVEWEPTVSKHRQLYSEFRLDFIKAEHFALRIPGQHETYGGDGTGQEEGEDDGAVGAFDEDTLDDDTRLFVDIRKDVWRTHSELSFFQADTRDAMTRMLYIYAKLNVGVRYVQGMNELLAPLYYTLSQDPSTIKEDVEPDTFFCFMNLMSVMRDTFIKPLDSSDGGIYGVIKAYSDMLRRHDKELWAHLERQGVNPQFYAFRWLTTLLSREFELPDAIRLWDTLFADPASPRLAALRCCTAMMILQRATLLRGDFATCLKFLQSYPPIELRDLLMMMHRVRKGEVKMADMRREQTATKPSLTGALFGGLSASFRPKLARTKSEGAALTAVEGGSRTRSGSGTGAGAGAGAGAAGAGDEVARPGPEPSSSSSTTDWATQLAAAASPRIADMRKGLSRFWSNVSNDSGGGDGGRAAGGGRSPAVRFGSDFGGGTAAAPAPRPVAPPVPIMAAGVAAAGDADGAGAEVERTASPASTDSDLVIRSSMYEAL